MLLLLNVMPISYVGKATNAVWKNGGMSVSESDTIGYENLTDGFTKLSVTDMRGYIDTPNLDDAPYYLSLSMKGLMPSGAEADGGRWAQLHISNGERNINWNPENEIYIEIPNSGYNPQNINVKNTVSGSAQTAGVAFEAERVYLFKFAKEDNKLVIYCDNQKLFEGEEELEVFSGEKLWFITLGNIGGNDTYKDYPLLIDTDAEVPPEPPADTNAVWKNGLGSLPSKVGYSYTENGFTKLSATDMRGYIDTPNLEEAPYYLKLSMKGLMPSGVEADGGRWAQLHISNGERNINWNPENEIYIEFPNDAYNPLNINVKNTASGSAQTEGVVYESEREYLFKFAKEDNKLVIYCDNQKLFEGEEELEVFSGEKLWFITLGNIGDSDTYKDYPIFIDTDVEVAPEPPLDTDAEWKNGQESIADAVGYSDMGNGFTQLTVTDARGCVPMPDLDEAPYYMMIGMEKLMPSGAEADGGRWAQLHISNGERNINWNPENEIYIEFPNDAHNPLNIKVKNSVDGAAQLEGVAFAAKKTYLFKFAKENNKLVIYCDDIKVFEGEEELQVFEGEKLWFITLGNIGDYDTFKDYPMFINPTSDKTEEPPFGDIQIPEEDEPQTPPDEPKDPEEPEETQSSWKNGGMSTTKVEGYKDMGDGFTKLTVADARGCVPMPDLDKAPYYMMLGMEKLMPSGAEADGGRWAQLHISNGERNINWNPENEIYIEFPNDAHNPMNIKVKNSVNGAAQFEGVAFAEKKTYLFKVAKENNRLVIYCDDVKVFEGEKELQVFEGEELWFITLGNTGEYDTFKDYPMFINPTSDKTAKPPFGEVQIPEEDRPETQPNNPVNPEKPVDMQSGWKNGGMSTTKGKGYKDMGDGFTKLTVTDARGCVPMPDLDKEPYYMMLGMEKLMPSGAEAEGGRWAQLHISSGERNINWNPENEIYIEFPNDGYNPKNIKVKNSVNGAAQFEGVAFAAKKTYLFKFAKENNKLVIFCDDIKVFEGKKELEVFSGDYLWFITLGNTGDYDTFKDYPIFINPTSDLTEKLPFGDIDIPKQEAVADNNEQQIPENGWKNGKTSLPKATGYSKEKDGFVKLSATDVRGCVPMPDISKKPYYMVLKSNEILPGGIEAEGGKWGQLHISNGERNPDWNPENEIYIELPNSGFNYKNINVKNSISGEAQTNGVQYAPETLYILKFEEKSNKLVISCNGEKLFEGKKELEVFKGDYLWVITLGNQGKYDTFKDYPLWINMNPEITEEPATYYYKGPKWGADSNKPARDIGYDYLDNGSARIYIESRYSIEGNFDDIGQSISTCFKNPNNKFEITFNQQVFNFETWQVIGFRPGDKLGAPADEPEVLCLEITNGPSYQLYYRKADGNRLDIIPATAFELGVDLKLNFELATENGIETAKFYVNNVLLGSSDNSEIIALMKSESLKAICVGHTTYDEPNVFDMRINNTPAEFEVTIPEKTEDEVIDKYVDLVINSKDDSVTVDGYLIMVRGTVTAKQLNEALISPEGTKLYVMTEKEELAKEDSVIDSSYSVMMLLDDQYETYVRSYNVFVVDETSANNSGILNIGIILIISISSILVFIISVVLVFIVMKKHKFLKQ